MTAGVSIRGKVARGIENRNGSAPSTTNNACTPWLSARANRPAEHRPRSGQIVEDGAHRPRQRKKCPKFVVDGHHPPWRRTPSVVESKFSSSDWSHRGEELSGRRTTTGGGGGDTENCAVAAATKGSVYGDGKGGGSVAIRRVGESGGHGGG